MSPEQARGETVGRQSDIWSFGVVLYELLTGMSPFARPTTAETLAQVLGAQPDSTRVPTQTPPGVVRLVGRCLEKDSRRRLQHIGDARIELEDLRRLLRNPPQRRNGARCALVWRSAQLRLWRSPAPSAG